MAVATLSPWPPATSAANRAAAVACLKPEVDQSLSDDRANALGEAASAMVERYAPGAPQAVKNEAVIRFAGYLRQSDFGGIVKEGIGPRDVEYTRNHAAAFRNCGAAMLLSPWKIRRAGVIG